MDRLIARCMHADPSMRPSAKEIHEELMVQPPCTLFRYPGSLLCCQVLMPLAHVAIGSAQSACTEQPARAVPELQSWCCAEAYAGFPVCESLQHLECDRLDLTVVLAVQSIQYPPTLGRVPSMPQRSDSSKTVVAQAAAAAVAANAAAGGAPAASPLQGVMRLSPVPSQDGSQAAGASPAEPGAPTSTFTCLVRGAQCGARSSIAACRSRDRHQMCACWTQWLLVMQLTASLLHCSSACTEGASL